MTSATAPRWRLGAAAAVLTPLLAVAAGPSPASAAKSDGCEGGGYRLVSSTGAVIASGPVDTSIPASAFGSAGTVGVEGRYNRFTIRLADFATLDYAFTGAANPLDMTGGRLTPVFASKVPVLRGASLTSDVSVELDGSDIEISRSGAAASMKVQAKDCAAGGVFQMEPERADGTRTRIVHTLATSATPGLSPFYFDNPNFRASVGQFLGADCTSVTSGPPSRFCVQVTTRVNIANDLSSRFVVRDSAQVATRVNQPDCNPATPITPSVGHCGSVAVWDVASGGRMGMVTGEDAIEVANPPTVCTHKCQAQNRVRGRLANLGFPFPVPVGSRLTPAVSAQPLPPLTPA
jgi:hypothetical protein